MAENRKEQPKNTIKKPKIAKKWQKYNFNHENYSPIGSTGKTLSWIPKNIPKKKRQNGKYVIK